LAVIAVPIAENWSWVVDPPGILRLLLTPLLQVEPLMEIVDFVLPGCGDAPSLSVDTPLAR
jgi:hypothetical protein